MTLRVEGAIVNKGKAAAGRRGLCAWMTQAAAELPRSPVTGRELSPVRLANEF
jgi:hypothetical protein